MNGFKRYKSFIIFIIFIFISSDVFGQDTRSALQLLDNAEIEFENGNLGIALKLTENAKEKRVSESTVYVETLLNALIPLAVQNAGDMIPDVREILVSRLESRAVAIIDEALLLHDADFFRNSITEIKNYYINRSVYPEAEFLLGKIYQAEGEYDIAKEFYFSALDHAYALDVPEQQIDIFYQTAYLAQLSGDDGLYEIMLMNILDYNPWFTRGDGISPYLKAAVDNSHIQESATKFFKLYRASHPQSINAAIQLTTFYKNKGDTDKAYTFAVLSSLLSFTRLYEVLEERDQRFEFTDLGSFFKTCTKYSDIVAWLENQSVWRGFYELAVLSKAEGNDTFADEIFSMLSKSCTDIVIKKLSSR